MKSYRTLLCFILISVTFHVAAQDHLLDSLNNELQKSKEDSNKVNTLIAISRKLISDSDPNAINFGLQARDLAKKINYKKGLALAFKTIGLLYNNQGKYLETLDYWQQSLETYESIGDKRGVANMQNNIGAVYFEQGDDAMALEYYLKSLKISEEIGDKLRIATAVMNIGAVYFKKKQTMDKALEYYLRALPLSEELEDQDAIGTVTVNLGEIYLDKLNYDTALIYFEKSLKAYENSPENMPYLLNDFGKVYDKKGDYKKAIEYQLRAVEIAKKLELKLDMAQALIGLGQTYYDLGDIKSSLAAYKEAEVLTKEIGARFELKDAYGGLANSYAEFSDYVNAYRYQSLLTKINDTIYNVETDKKLGALQFDFDIQKKQSQINLLTKDKKIQEADLRRQTVIKNVTISGLGIVLLFLIVVFFQKKKITLEKQRSEALLLNILPAETAEELKATGTAKAKSFDMVTVMFTDFKNFTQASEKLSAEELVHEINICYSEFDKIISKYSIEKIKTIGDSYMCAGGLPATSATHPEDVVKAGLEMQRFIEKNKAARIEIGQPFFELRLGIHTGPVVAGIVGIKKFAYDIWGDTVNTASRMESSGETGKVNVSGTTYELVKDKFICVHRGKIKAKNKGEIDMYFIEGELNSVESNQPALAI